LRAHHLAHAAHVHFHHHAVADSGGTHRDKLLSNDCLHYSLALPACQAVRRSFMNLTMQSEKELQRDEGFAQIYRVDMWGEVPHLDNSALNC